MLSILLVLVNALPYYQEEEEAGHTHHSQYISFENFVPCMMEPARLAKERGYNFKLEGSLYPIYKKNPKRWAVHNV